MKRLAKTMGFVLLLALSPLAAAVAQGVTLAVKAGANGADISFDPEEDTGLTLGLIGGATVGFGLHEAFAIQVEALFSQKGAEIVVGFDDFIWASITSKSPFSPV